MSLLTTQLLVEKILEHAGEYEWSLQGLGLFRFYFRDRARLHIWDHRYAWAMDSAIHDHSWDLSSTIISGKLNNQRYVEHVHGEEWNKGRIVAGYNAQLVDTKLVKLAKLQSETYWPGQTYSQKADEIHMTYADYGTITIMERDQGDPDAKVHVYFPKDHEWTNGKPRKLEAWEIKPVAEYALVQLRKHFER